MNEISLKDIYHGVWIEFRLLAGIKLLSLALSVWPEGWGKRQLCDFIIEFVGSDEC